MVWTNDDLARFHSLGLISIVGQIDEEKPSSAFLRTKYVKTQDPEWYAVQAAKLRDALQHRQVQLHEYQQALEDTRDFKRSTGGIDRIDRDFATTPEAGVEILQQRAAEEQGRLDDLEDLARRNGIEPDTLRGP